MKHQQIQVLKLRLPQLFFIIATLINISFALAKDSKITADHLRYEDVIGSHEVQVGESLAHITKKYLGDFSRWRDNWKLNATLKNPNRIFPGQRLKIIVERRIVPEPVIKRTEIPVQNASLNKAFNAVEKNLQRNGWITGLSGDQLRSNDGVRTKKQSSAELEFDHGDILVMSEFSQLFLRGTSPSDSDINRSEIEIEKGAAELSLVNGEPNTAAIEVKIGDAISRPVRWADGIALTRSQRMSGGLSQVMVYSGTSEVEANGVIVDVAQGMGTSIQDGNPPSEPVKLLPPPSVIEPTTTMERETTFSWQPVDGTAHYRLEICHDERCGSVVKNISDLLETHWREKSLPTGILYWRVSAINATGLQGYPSPPTKIVVSEYHPLLTPQLLAIIAGIVILIMITFYVLRRIKSK